MDRDLCAMILRTCTVREVGDEVGVCDRHVLDDRVKAPIGGRGQIIAPRERRDRLTIGELPLGFEVLALGGVHRRLPPDVHQCAGGTIQAASRERQADREQAKREGSDLPGNYHRLCVNRHTLFHRCGTDRRLPWRRRTAGRTLRSWLPGSRRPP